MREVEVERIEWLWYPYIPFGKITVMQGDGGDGKTTTVLAIAAALTSGLILPETDAPLIPSNVIFQTAEDGLGDTIKPRLIQSGADCGRVLVIDESEKELTLSDSRIAEALKQTGAKLFILDPLQAYLGADVDMYRANEVRPVLKRLGHIAAQSGCAFVIVGHLNKGANKSQYRGLGSIDIQSAARSVLTFGRINGQPNMRAFAQGKSNLAPEGAAIAYELHPETGFRWIGRYPVTIDELLRGSCGEERESTYDRAVMFLKTKLRDNALPAKTVFELAAAQDISARTLKKAKADTDVKSFKQDNQWFWALPYKTEEGGNSANGTERHP